MDITFAVVLFEEIEQQVHGHYRSLPSKIEAFMEDHIVNSLHLRISIDGQSAGFASIRDEKLITQFAMDEPYRAYGQLVFARLRKMEQVTSAYVPTSDEFYLAHALDDHRQVLRQAYFFSATAAAMKRQPPDGYRFVAATLDDAETIRELTGDFLAPIEERIGREELFLNWRGDDLVGFGIREMSRFYPNTASIGMFTIESYRGTGAGTATIAHLIAKCAAEGIHPLAGCWYYNHRSKRTLERAGMHPPTRLLRVEY